MVKPDDWFSPGEIRFTRRTALWLIHVLGNLREGHWPPEASDYIDLPGKKGVSARAPFAMPIEYAAEITARLERCGEDGLMLLASECWGETDEALAKYFKKPEWVIRRRKSSALGYIASGPARRWLTTKKRAAETYGEFKLRKGTPKARLPGHN